MSETDIRDFDEEPAPITSMFRASASFLGKLFQSSDDLVGMANKLSISKDDDDVGDGGEYTIGPSDLPSSASTAVTNDSTENSQDVLLCKEVNNQSKRKNRYKKLYRDEPARERPVDDIWPERDALSFTRSLVFYGTGAITDEHEEACKAIMEARETRKKYQGGDGTIMEDIPSTNLSYKMQNGVFGIYDMDGETNLIQVPNIDDFVKDYRKMERVISSGAMRSFCYQRMQMLDSAFNMHVCANATVENEAQSNLLGTDFYRTMKIDNHIHLAAAASANQFVNFVKNKLETEGDEVVLENGQTLKEVFDSAGLTADHLTIDAFNVLADYSVYQRFDNFNGKYSPFRMAQIRKIFLKVENIQKGRYFAELTKEVFSRLEQSKGHRSAAEMRLSIYGMERHEWRNLADWVLNDWKGKHPGPVLSSHNRWIVQVPRLWRIFCRKDPQNSFQKMLENLFAPIFEATLYPDEHPEVAELLKHIVGFDSVDDEGCAEAPTCCTRPADWTKQQNPAYNWQLYFLWANIEVLNRLRHSKGLNTFSFRPHAGETGDPMHLAATYILADSINHGVNLDKQVSLQYLYYLDQIGLSMSPLSNNFLFRKIKSNPFPKLFKRGLNVTLSTDDPLLFHMSNDALLEEYSVARASFDLSMTDISEIARNSVLQSGFEDNLKEEWLGKDYHKGITFCDEVKTHVPLIRAKFRAEHLALEHMLVNLIAAGKGEEVLKEMMYHFGKARDAHRNILVNNLPDVRPFPEQNQL